MMVIHRNLLLILLAVSMTAAWAKAGDLLVLFGTHRAGLGFSLGHFNDQTGALSKPEATLAADAPGYFVIHPDGRHIYVANEINSFQGQKAGAISAYALDPATGQLTLLNQASTVGAGPAYVGLDPTGKYAMVANYGGGSIAAFAIQPDGSIGPRTAFIQHSGRGPDASRQTSPHPHSIQTDPTGRFVLVPDLGQDKVFIYRFDKATGAMTPNDPPFAAVEPGAGPRHLAFHPNGRWVYVINEMAGTVDFFNWDADRGVMTPVQTIASLPADYHEAFHTSGEIAVHPSGNFLYTTNRGPNDLAVFAIDPGTGRLSPIQHISTGGKMPRFFTFDPSGRWLLVANHDSDNVVVFKVDGQTGLLTQVGDPVAATYVFCGRFLPSP
jgi:6-phosphogluconolactonase